MKRSLTGFLLLLSTIAGIAIAIQGIRKAGPFVAAAGISLPFVVIAFTSPLARRLAIRNAKRRPRETVLILLGSLLGTTIIASAAVVGDAFDETIRNTAYTQLGPVDEIIEVQHQEVSNQIEARLVNLPRNNIDGLMSLRATSGAAAVAGIDPRAVSNVSFYELSFAQAAAFGNDQHAVGISGEDLKVGTVAITRQLADKLDVEPGDTIDLYMMGEKHSVTVDRLLPVRGVAGLRTNGGEQSLNVFVPKGTITPQRSDGFQSWGISYLTLVSNNGGVLDGKLLSKTVAQQLETQLSGASLLPPEEPGQFRKPVSTSVPVQQIKAERLKEASDAGRIFARIFVGIGSFTIIAGILLVINIFTMLAQERQSELGMLRAIGMRRRSLISTFSFEGFLYGLGSASLGVVAGIGVGWLIVRLANSIFSQIDENLRLIFAIEPVNMAWAFLGGLGITVLTVVLASLFISRMNVIRAIRELPDTTFHRRRIIGLLLGLLLVITGVITTLSGINSKNEFAALLGPAVTAVGATLFLRRWVATKLLLTITSIAVLIWSVIAFTVIKKVFANANPGVYVLQGVQLTAFAVMLISADQEHIGGLLRRIGGGTWSMALRLGLAYPLARRGRTGLLLAMFSLVMFVLIFITTVSHILTTSVREIVTASARGTDIVAERGTGVSFDEPKPLPVEALRNNADIARAAVIESNGIRLAKASGGLESDYELLAVDENFIGNGSAKLVERDPAYKTDEDAFRALVKSDNLIIVRADAARENGQRRGLAIGERVKVRSYDESAPTKELTVVGVTETGTPLVIGQRTAATFMPKEQRFISRVHLQVKPGRDPEVVARQLAGLHIEDNINIYPVKAEIEKGFTVMRQFLMLLQGYLAIGLLVGIAGLGVVMVRAVRERRRQIGMLRAMGFSSRSIRHAFLAESAFIAGEGILIGAGLALIVLARLFASLPAEFEIEFRIPWIPIALLTGGTFLAAIAATAMPAQAASRIPPAVALRTVD